MDGKATLTIETLINDMKTATSRMSRIRHRAGSFPAGYSVVFASDVVVRVDRACVILSTLLQSFDDWEVGKGSYSALLRSAIEIYDAPSGRYRNPNFWFL